VAEDWRKDAVAKALAARATEIKTALEGGAKIGTFGIVDVTPETARAGFVADVPETLLPEVFKMADGAVQVIEAEGFTAVVQLDRIMPAAAEGEDAMALKASLEAQAGQAISQDAFAAYTAALTAEAGITLDQAAITAVHTSLP
jgi:peptidyl-prolyl cis-trans isomerase D